MMFHEKECYMNLIKLPLNYLRPNASNTVSELTTCPTCETSETNGGAEKTSFGIRINILTTNFV